MRMNRKAALSVGASMAVALLAACSDSPTATPVVRSATTPSFALGNENQTPSPTAVVGKVVVCKVGDTAGSFAVNRTDVGTTAGTAVTSPISIPAGECRTVVEDFNANTLNGSRVTVTEAANGTVVQTIEACQFVANPGGTSTCAFDNDNNAGTPTTPYVNGQSVFINNYHGYVITYRNTTPPPPPSGCTYTKGWYQNKNGAPTIIAGIDGRSKADQTAIFEASPGQPGNVTWGSNNKPNNLLNLYQQLLAALNNLGGNPLGGPPSVDAAIAAALAATGGSGTNITVITGTDIGALIGPLSDFNEGKVAGFPHCSDEVLPQ